MKKQFEEHFERTWLIIFLFMFVILMIPFPFFYMPRHISLHLVGFRFFCLDGLCTQQLHLR